MNKFLFLENIDYLCIMRYNTIKKNFMISDEVFDDQGYIQALRDKRREYRNKNSIRNRYNPQHILKRYLYSAKKRNILFELTEDQFFNTISQPCYYCGKNNSNGVDRLDSSNGYVIDNILPCCGMCNKMKYTHTIDEFISQVKRIYDLHCK